MVYSELSNKILLQLNQTSSIFGGFQKATNIMCPTGCGRCCFKSDIVCNPFELLPLALYLVEKNLADNVLTNALEHQNNRCIFLTITNEDKGHGYCKQYDYRPFICRAFGVAGRINKYGVPEYSICNTLKENNNIILENPILEIPCIEKWKKKLEGLDPKLAEKEIPINQALAVILEKVLLVKTFQ